jgi:hypothetical protein
MKQEWITEKIMAMVGIKGGKRFHGSKKREKTRKN